MYDKSTQTPRYNMHIWFNDIDGPHKLLMARISIQWLLVRTSSSLQDIAVQIVYQYVCVVFTLKRLMILIIYTKNSSLDLHLMVDIDRYPRWRIRYLRYDSESDSRKKRQSSPLLVYIDLLALLYILHAETTCSVVTVLNRTSRLSSALPYPEHGCRRMPATTRSPCIYMWSTQTLNYKLHTRYVLNDIVNPHKLIVKIKDHSVVDSPHNLLITSHIYIQRC